MGLSSPHDVGIWLLDILLIVSAIAVVVLLRRYWWRMVCALLPDIIDWVILNRLAGEHPIHDLIGKVSTLWGLALEMLCVAVVVLVLGLKGRTVLTRALQPERADVKAAELNRPGNM